MKLRYFFVYVASFVLIYWVLSTILEYLPIAISSNGVNLLISLLLLVVILVVSKIVTDWALERPLPKRQGTV
ncbi:hypothetical protein MKY84_01890 [Chryseomicrobium sp. FSL W7-1435]|uniref:hypothetical protein n=1 Tax=Chryseomicrobium sp. FSL W7-1435 TaxID=2921704 RepID=UPI00315ADB44